MSITKESLRERLLATRNSLLPNQIVILSDLILEKIRNHPKFISSNSIFLYSSFGSEVLTSSLIDCAKKDGKEVFLPVLTKNSELEFHLFESFSKMKKGKFGILEPTSKIKSTTSSDLIIVPGVGFDLSLHRLGYGKGYYDKFLKNISSYKIGICFDFQIISKIPILAHDQKMDEIISEKRIVT